MTGSARRITSPSSSRTTRSTPWVEGCCGPMLRIISSVFRPWPSAISMSRPPPRTIQCSAAEEKAVRSSVSIRLHSAARGRKPTRAHVAAAWAEGRLTSMAQVTRKERPGLRRGIPSVDALLRSAPGVRIAEAVGRPLLKQALTSVLLDVRTEAAAGVSPPEDDVLLARAAQLASSVVTGLTPAINATGVILHTGLGRARLPANAAKAAAKVARSYSDLEVDRARGLRGKRTTRAEALLTAITGAEAAFVVNNNAAALLLMLAATARRKDVLVSRGELIEIGGEFRLPDIMAASGAKLVEVGTTNRTRIGDYRSALTEKTGAILKVHPSNYRVVGFSATPTTKVLADLARPRGVPLLYDLGSGLLRKTPGLPDDEPSVRD